MSATHIVTGEAYAHNEIETEIARKWARARLINAPYLYGWMVRGLIQMRTHYHFVGSMQEGDFLHGLYLGLCDHFNGGCDIDDLTSETRELLNI